MSAWLTNGRVDQKRVDALAMLAAMREARGGEPKATRPYSTLNGPICGTSSSPRSRPAEGPGASARQRILEELRIEGPDAYGPVEHVRFCEWSL